MKTKNKDLIALPEGSNGRAEIEKEYDMAIEAVEKADATELYRLYEVSLKRNVTVFTAMNALVEHYAGSKENPRLAEKPSGDVVKSMESVALAAIKLAETVSSKSK